MAGNRFSVRSALPADIEMIGYPALLSRPGFEPAMCRVGEADGLILSHALAERYTLRYGGARLREKGNKKNVTKKNINMQKQRKKRNY